MRFRLRTLLYVLTVGPPILAGACLTVAGMDPDGILGTLALGLMLVPGLLAVAIVLLVLKVAEAMEK